jgi:hypothetical protein
MTQEITKKPQNIFDHLQNITFNKGEFLGEEGWNNYMINRFLSQDEDYCEVVNFIQKNTWQMQPKYLYNLYKDVIPKRKVYLKYIKATNIKKYNDEDINAVKQYFEVSKKQAKQYIDILPKNELEFIKQQINGN